MGLFRSYCDEEHLFTDYTVYEGKVCLKRPRRGFLKYQKKAIGICGSGSLRSLCKRRCYQIIIFCTTTASQFISTDAIGIQTASPDSLSTQATAPICMLLQ